MRKLIVITAAIAAILATPAAAGAHSHHHRHHGHHAVAHRVHHHSHRLAVRKADVEEVAEVECAPEGVECELPEVTVADTPELMELPVEEEP